MAGHDPGNGSTADGSDVQLPGPIRFLFENSLFLIGGAVLALIWANLDNAGYQRFVNAPLTGHANDHGHAGGDTTSHGPQTHAPATSPESSAAATPTTEATPTAAHPPAEAPPAPAGGHHGLTFHFLVNDVLMALFFAMATKEVWESLLPGGALSNPRKAATPLMATAGGVVFPAAVYAIGALMIGEWSTLGRGWAIPCATDIAFSYLVARLIFGDSHPAIPFLLLLAIADDAAGLMILAVAYPQQAIQPQWFLLTAGAIGTGYLFRALGIKNFWAYLIVPGILCWTSFYKAGIHAALGLVPIIPTMPHAHTDIGFFAKSPYRHDTLSEFEHWWDHPVELILGLFGLVNAGVVFSNVGDATLLVMIGLVLGKPLGIFLFTWIATRLMKLEMPLGVTDRHILALGVVAGIGFTVALFVATTAFPNPGAVQDAAKMGALGSFFSAVIAFPVAWMLRIKRLKPGESAA